MLYPNTVANIEPTTALLHLKGTQSAVSHTQEDFNADVIEKQSIVQTIKNLFIEKQNYHKLSKG